MHGLSLKMVRLTWLHICIFDNINNVLHSCRSNCEATECEHTVILVRERIYTEEYTLN
jgi:hypothetical protein